MGGRVGWGEVSYFPMRCREMSMLSTRGTSHTVPPIVVTKDPLEWTGDREAHTNRVLPSVSKGWTCKACGDRSICAGCAIHAFRSARLKMITPTEAPRLMFCLSLLENSFLDSSCQGLRVQKNGCPRKSSPPVPASKGQTGRI